MVSDTSNAESTHHRAGLLKDQVRVVKRKGTDRYEIAPIPDNLSFEKGFFVVVRACQLLAQRNHGLVVVGIAGPSGAGKTVFTEKIINFMPDIAVISMDNYNDSSRIIDGNFDDPRLTDYETLLKNIHDLKAGRPAEVPIYDFKSSSRTGYRTVGVPSSNILIIEGIYALSEKLRPLLDLRVSVTGGVHFDLVKRVLRDIQRAGQEPQEIIHQISETVYPMYKAFIEADLRNAHIKIRNKFNPFTGFQSPTYILKSMRNVTVEQVKSVMSEGHSESTEQTYDIYLLPPGEDPETCQSYLRMRNKDGKYNLMFEEWVLDPPFVISPRITFEVSVRLLGGLMALGYTIAAILKRNSHVFTDEGVSVKIDWLEQLNRHYVQVQGRDRLAVKSVADQLGLEGSYIPRTFIEQIQIEKLINEVMELPEDLKSKLSIDEDCVSSPKATISRPSAATKIKNLRSGMSHSYSTNRDRNLSKLETRFEDRTAEAPMPLANQLAEQISTLNDRMDVFMSCIEGMNSKLSSWKTTPTSRNASLQAEVCNGSAPTSYFLSSLGSGSLLPSSSSSQLAKESSLTEELSSIVRGQHQVMHQLDVLSTLLRANLGERSDKNKAAKKNPSKTPVIIASLALGSLGFFCCKDLLIRK
ncbi:inorganic pyrophosphatase TTM2-like [Andrographis paniculata]|uniref:inorganic pyrophosphatase TTM2-like n=1 Tax=Andrographis paniculata TaxID=175694 RepID=UPI0021E8A24D|nr:inorganic pyrophosphatase TTM2-like [Andrographis paniculata]XP_051148763.1 inorganic pyrophosphatase TTM2-like [Andrographis paniculata]XP_051148764.1 inorganic pyrophosphatase TTM2-like [Andrographis paniculata]XP_051148765.1 inorganic pyrophosphatase TTM2-like [Andrographis paniculata]